MKQPFPDDLPQRVRDAFEPERDADAAIGMTRYMRGLFPFLGIPSPRRRELQRDLLNGLERPSPEVLLSTATTLWEFPEREYQYVATDLLSRHAAALRPQDLATVRELIVSKSWWDTVDALAAHVVGTMVGRHPELRSAMDRWISDDNLWIARTALLHQLRFKTDTDAVRLFRYCELQSSHTDFFIRKAIGWALREYSKTDAEAVRSFVASHASALSPLSQREALLWLNGGRNAKAQ